ncbi:energy transducer TonB [Sphingomonas sp. SM33]|uniref:Energy transducer TonB n=1 Tax=Sphingomonas telluris TaxID=2907998 RepID=A0ABS9VJH1_9SPHN|nr:energy transducer TonB [Sphingomonas telluris]MCH8614522.1 energy transducer TonB [Sphingomonas telluris]
MASAAPPPVLQPSGKWVVEYADNMCVLQRDYGTPENRVTLSFRPAPMTDWTSIFVFEAASQLPAERVPVNIGFSPGGAEVKGRLSSFNLSGASRRYNATGLSRADLDKATAAGVLSLDAGDNLRVAFSLPDFRKAVTVLDDCVADLLDQWGFSQAQQAAMAELPKPKYGINMNFPGTAARKEQTGANSARIRLDSRGKPSDCRIVEASQSKSLDWAICWGLLHTAFTPAKDKNGKPMESMFFTRTQWIIPKGCRAAGSGNYAC